jgi:hypothetical protein
VAVLVALMLAAGPVIAAAQDIPAPRIALVGTETYEAGGRDWTRYNITVTNRSAFPDGLFVPAPALPPCGRNANASRTWVDIYDGQGARLYGFCALRSAQDLDGLWFAVKRNQPPPPQVYIVLADRQTGRTYRSNVIAIR